MEYFWLLAETVEICTQYWQQGHGCIAWDCQAEDKWQTVSMEGYYCHMGEDIETETDLGAEMEDLRREKEIM